MKITVASAGENRHRRSQAIGSSASRRQPCNCSAVSSRSCSSMRAEASRFGVTSSFGKASSCSCKSRNSLSTAAHSAAPSGVLLQFEARIVGQLVVEVKRYVLLNPLAIHDFFLLSLSYRSRRVLLLSACAFASAARNFWVARNSVFLAVSSLVFSVSPMVRSRSPS